MKAIGIDKADDGGQFAILRQNRGHLVKRPQSGGCKSSANGRGDWIGFVDLKVEAVNEVATQMTAKVVRTVNANVIGLIEAESRPSLIRFHDQILKPGGTTYEQIDADRRKRRSRNQRRHHDPQRLHDRVHAQSCGRRDRRQAHIQSRLRRVSASRRPRVKVSIVLVNHFKSKGFGSPAESNEKRKAQAERVKAIYDGLVKDGAKNIAVIGDLNDRRPAIRSSRCSRTPT